MKVSFTAMMIALVATSASAGRMPASQTATPPAASELVYDTYCKKEQSEKRQLFRAATPAQKVTLATTQLERWRDANRPAITKEQATALDELLKMVTEKMFEPSDAGRAMLEQFETTARAFRGRQLDEMAPDGPCIAKK